MLWDLWSSMLFKLEDWLWMKEGRSLRTRYKMTSMMSFWQRVPSYDHDSWSWFTSSMCNFLDSGLGLSNNNNYEYSVILLKWVFFATEGLINKIVLSHRSSFLVDFSKKLLKYKLFHSDHKIPNTRRITDHKNKQATRQNKNKNTHRKRLRRGRVHRTSKERIVDQPKETQERTTGSE